MRYFREVLVLHDESVDCGYMRLDPSFNVVMFVLPKSLATRW